MNREHATSEARLQVLNVEYLYRRTHDTEGRYVVATPGRLRARLAESLADLMGKRDASRIDWQALHAELSDDE